MVLSMYFTIPYLINHYFSANTSSVQCNVSGWRYASNDSNYKVKYNDNMVSATIFSGTNITYTTSPQEFGAEVLKHGSVDLRPEMPMAQISPSGDIIYLADTSYKMKYFRLSGTHQAGAYASFLYARR